MMGDQKGQVNQFVDKPPHKVSNTEKKSKIYKYRVGCTLEELAVGKTKKLKMTFQDKQRIYNIKLRPGWKDGTKVTFQGKKNIPTMVFVIEELPHQYLERREDNLHYTHYISESLIRAEINLNILLPSGENWSRTLNINNGLSNSVLANGKRLVIPSKGMPIKGGPTRGNLIVEFRIRNPAPKKRNYVDG